MKNIVFRRGLTREDLPEIEVGDTILTNHSEEPQEGFNCPEEDLEKLVVKKEEDELFMVDVGMLERQRKSSHPSKFLKLEVYSLGNYQPLMGWFSRISGIRSISEQNTPDLYEEIMDVYRRKY